MKKLLESLDECGMNEMPPMIPPMEKHEGNPVTMNVSLNASGKEHVEDLLNMMKNAGMQAAEPASAKMLSPRLDMERLRGIVDDPKIPGKDDDEDDHDLQAAAGTVNSVGDIVGSGPTDVARPSSPDTTVGSKAQSMEDSYANEPDEDYKELDDVISSGDDLHKSKKAYRATQDGDNPMAVDEDMVALEQEIKKALQAEYAKRK